MTDDHGLHRLQSLAALPDAGLEVVLEAKPAERRSLAEFLEVLDVKRLRARLVLKRWRGHGVQVTGTVDAEVVQSCIVTLEPVTSRLELEIDRKFLPESMLAHDGDPHEMLIDPDGEDPPEPMPHSLDLGELAAEEVALNVDPYPRKAGAEAPEAEAEIEIRGENPFAALKNVLKP